jgi:hypothetical protein
MGIVNNEFASEGSKTVARAMLQKRISAEQKDPLDTAVKQTQLEGMRLSNQKAMRELNEQGFTDKERPDGSLVRYYKDGSKKQIDGPMAKEEGQTAYMKELEAENAVRKQRGQPLLSVSEYRTALNRAGASQVNIDQKSESKFDEQFKKGQGDMFSKFLENKGNNESDAADIGQLRDLMNEGLPTGAIGTAQKVLGKVGIQTDGLGKIQSFEAIINRLVPAQRQPGSGTMSDRDVELYKSALPNLMSTPDGMQRILNTMEGMVKYKQAQTGIAEKLANGTTKREDAIKELQSIKNPLSWLREQNKPKSSQSPESLTSGNKTKSGVTWSVE